MKKNTATATTQSQANAQVNAINTSTTDTINSLAVKAFATVILKGDKSIVDAFKAKLEERKTAALATIQSNWDNGVLDKDGLPKGSAPNDLYNSISECEIMAKCIRPEDSERIELAANTVRKIVATVCSEITSFKSKLAGKTGKVRSSAAADESYL